MVARAEAHSEAAGLGPRLRIRLAAGAHVLYRLEVSVGEDCVVVGEQGWALELGSAWEREAARVVRAKVEDHLEGARAGIVCILRHLLEQSALRIVDEHIPQPHAEIHLLAEVGPSVLVWGHGVGQERASGVTAANARALPNLRAVSTRD